jgi:hypothetical protein
MGLSFVDRDMIMRYFGGGIGHLGNSPRQANSEQPDTEGVEEELEINDDGIDNLNASGPGEVEDIIMNFEVENSDDERGGLGPESESDSDEESDEGSDDDSEGSEEDANERASVDPEDSDDDGYGSF